MKRTMERNHELTNEIFVRDCEKGFPEDDEA